MKKVYKIILIILILFMMFPIKSKAVDSNNINGDLRCNPSSKNCIEKKDANGLVYETIVTSKDDNITIEKHVKKTNIPGELEVWFEGKSNKELGQISADTHVIVLFDDSISMRYYQEGNKVIYKKDSCKSEYNEYKKNGIIPSNKKCKKYPAAVSGAKKFINSFKDEKLSNVKLEIIRFSAKKVEKIINENFPKEPSTTNGTPLYTAINSVIEEFKNDDGKKIVVWFGDGNPTAGSVRNNNLIEGESVIKYDKNSKTVKIMKKKIEELKNMGVDTYSIGYQLETGSKEHSPSINKNNAIKWFEEFSNKKFLTASIDGDNDNVLKVFEEIATDIKNDIIENNKINGIINDNIGPSFTIKNEIGKSKNIYIEKISKEGFKTNKFIIKINDDANDWNNTNTNFTFSYKDLDTKKDFLITSSYNDQPQVYWKEIVCTDSITDEKEKVIKSCSGTESIDLEIKSNCQSEKKIYYDISCDEKITANIKINNLNDGVKKFSIDKGLGFPANLNLKTDLKCNYIFYKGLYDNDYNKLTLEISKETDEKIIHSKTKKLNEMKSYLETYNSYLNNLNDYKTNVFSNQAATLKVKVLDNSYDYQDFINSNFKINEDNCKDTETYQDGFKVTTKTCSLKMEKDMILTEKCLNMKDGSVENCTNSNKQIKGGNKYYTSINKNSGSVFVEINSLGYASVINNKSNISIKLEDCEYETDKLYKDKISFRQIELSDPFLKSYTNSKREIGKNYSNTKYDFVSIIKPDIWSLSTSDYKFSLSKINVSNIRHDTNNLGVSSYLGSDCYINNLNKYVCNFFEDNENNNFFTNIEK